MNSPKWNGIKVKNLDLTGKLMPWSPLLNMPMLICVDGCDDAFVMVFPDEESLEKGVEFVLASMDSIEVAMYEGRTIKHIDDGIEFCKSIWEQGIRIMYNPEFISKTRTKWVEPVSDESNLIKHLRTDIN